MTFYLCNTKASLVNRPITASAVETQEDVLSRSPRRELACGANDNHNTFDHMIDLIHTCGHDALRLNNAP